MHALVTDRFNASTQTISGLSAEDRFEIVELCHRFDHAINRMDQAATGPMFASSASLITPKGPVEGRDAIVAFFTSVAPLAKGNRHLTVDIVVDPAKMVSGLPSARAASYRLLITAVAPTSLVASGTIDDEFIKENGTWKFVSRKFVMDAPSPDAIASQSK
eukprot:365542-Chlamydomonas_euryale.AAC.44